MTMPNVISSKGRMVAVSKTDTSANAVTISGTVNGSVNPSLACSTQPFDGVERHRMAFDMTFMPQDRISKSTFGDDVSMEFDAQVAIKAVYNIH